MKHLHKLALLLLLLLGAALQSEAAEWLKITSQDGVSYYIYSNVYSVTGEEYSYKAWIKTTYDTPAARAAAQKRGKYKYVPYERKTLYVFSYDWSKIDFIQVAIYRKNGDIIDSHSFDYVDMQDIIPESFGETFAESAKSLYQGN